jgi:hypothetical protein
MSWAPAESEPGGGRSDAAPIGLLAGASEASVWADQPLGAARPATLSVPALPNPRVPATWLLRGARHPRVSIPGLVSPWMLLAMPIAVQEMVFAGWLLTRGSMSRQVHEGRARDLRVNAMT